MDLLAHGSSIILMVSILLLFSAVYFISTYNRLQKLSNEAESTLS